jgi:citrate lyase subunit beta / citryl-CoA lyase
MRSTILVPAHQPHFLAKARGFEADLVVLDLEDSVPLAEATKRAARDGACAALREHGWRSRSRAVRVNGPRTPWFAADVAAIMDAGATAIVLPHVYGVDDVLGAEMAIARIGAGAPMEIHLPIETPGLLLDLEAVARQARMVVSLAIAPNDYALESGSNALARAEIEARPAVSADELLAWPRAKAVAVARARGWHAIDAPMVADVGDMDAMRRAMERSRMLGFDGAALLHPRFIDLANHVYRPSAAELAWAHGVVEAHEAFERGEAGAQPAARQRLELAQRLRAAHRALTATS